MGENSKETTMKLIKFGIIGGGWRAEFFLRIARALPERFKINAMMVRDELKGEKIETKWGVPTTRELDALLETPDMDFVVVSVPWSVSPVMLRELANRGIPALAETPPAPDLEELVSLYRLAQSMHARIQVAEQYQFQPLHAARIALAQSGKLGTITQAQVSIAHGYHGISLMRQFLGVSYEKVTLQAREFTSPIISGPDRAGPPVSEKPATSHQIIANLDFGNKLGIFDFTGDQYFSWIRSPRLLVRGERGEINGSTVRYLKDYQTPIELQLRRVNAGEDGNLEGYYLKGILAGEEWVYRNPFIPGRLTDDEIAIATCLDKMARYVSGGPEFYGLGEASQDHYLSLMINQALKTGEPVIADQQPWAAPATR